MFFFNDFNKTKGTEVKTENRPLSSVIKSYRHKGVAQVLMQTLRKELKAQGVDTLICLIASNEEAQRFYRNLPNSEIKEEGIWIDL